MSTADSAHARTLSALASIWFSALVLFEVALTSKHLRTWAPSESNDNAVVVSAVTILGIAFVVSGVRALRQHQRLPWLAVAFLVGEPLYLFARALRGGYPLLPWVLASAAILLVSIACIVRFPPTQGKAAAA
jgi:hypothetical protein